MHNVLSSLISELPVALNRSDPITDEEMDTIFAKFDPK